MSSPNEIDPSTAVGLDVGTSRIVAARHKENNFHYQSQLNAFISIPYSKLTENVLQKERVPYSTIEEREILVHGNESERFAALLNGEVRRPMTRGVLNPDEPNSVMLLREITASLAGPASQAGQKVCFTVPAAPLGSAEGLTYHETTMRQILRDLGYEPASINEGLAIIYGELESSNYTGIGISCGGGLCNVCLAYLSVPVVSFSVAKAGDFIDASAASVTGERANHVRLMKEQSFYLNGHFVDRLHQVLSVYYEDMIQALVAGLVEAFANARNLPKFGRPIPLVLSGGSTLPKGFLERFEKVLGESDFPLPLSEIRLAADPLRTTAKGALVAALVG